MRKKKNKYANLIMLLLILFVLFFIVIQNRTIKVSANELIQNYSSNISEADKRYLNNELEISGNAKSSLQIEGKDFLELHSNNQDFKIYCKLLNQETITKASSITTGTEVFIFGKCLGINSDSEDSLLNVIYIEASVIK